MTHATQHTSNLTQSSLSFFSSCLGSLALTSAFVALERKLTIFEAEADVAVETAYDCCMIDKLTALSDPTTFSFFTELSLLLTELSLTP